MTEAERLEAALDLCGDLLATTEHLLAAYEKAMANCNRLLATRGHGPVNVEGVLLMATTVTNLARRRMMLLELAA